MTTEPRHSPDPDGRTRHYGTFYDVPAALRTDGVDPADDRPLWLVHGNCQAEALRVVLATAPDAPYRTVRIPPVHELTADDVPHLAALLGRTGVLLSQPVRDDYRDLPLGTDQLAALLPAGARVLRWPVVRFTGLHPWQAIIRNPANRSLDPPVVPYHDLRTVAAALTPGALAPLAAFPATAEGIRTVGDAAVAELARRETAHADVGVSDVLDGLGTAAAHTLNHPGNAVLAVLAQRVQAGLGAPVGTTDPGRVLLGGVRAPLEAAVLAARGLPGPPRPTWVVGGQDVDPAHVHAVQAQAYRDDPGWLTAATARHRVTMETLGLG
ncbi:hypothetical protein GCM10027047_04650 [Rhodococcus aerolatus]